MKDFNFAEHRDEIKVKIDNRLARDKITDKDGFTIVEGFISPVIKPDISEFISLDGKIFLMIAVIANSTGRVYQYSAKELFPDEEVLY